MFSRSKAKSPSSRVGIDEHERERFIAKKGAAHQSKDENATEAVDNLDSKTLIIAPDEATLEEVARVKRLLKAERVLVKELRSEVKELRAELAKHVDDEPAGGVAHSFGPRVRSSFVRVLPGMSEHAVKGNSTSGKAPTSKNMKKAKKKAAARTEVAGESSGIQSTAIQDASIPVILKPADVRSLIEQACTNHPLFAGLSPGQLLQLVGAFYAQQFQAGQVVIRKGDMGDWFAAVETGKYGAFLLEAEQATAAAASEAVANYHKGDTFGELALLYDSARATTIICKEEGTLWVLERASLRKVQQNNTAAMDQAASPAMFMKTIEIFSRLTEAQRDALATISELATFEPGQPVYRQSDPVEAFYCVVKGQLKMVNSRGEVARQCYRGGFFGVSSVATHERKQSEDAIAVTSLTVLRLLSKPFKKLVKSGELPQSLRKDLTDLYTVMLLTNVPFLQPLNEGEKRALVEGGAFTHVKFKSGTDIVSQGEPGESMYIVKAGYVNVSRVARETRRRSSVGGAMGAGFFFGEVALLKPGEVRMATVAANTDVECLELGRDQFERLVGSNMAELMNREAAKRKREAIASASQNESASLFESLTLGAVLGAGGYGKVRVATTSEGQAYALKSMSKAHIMKRNQVEHTKSERDILSFCDHPFLPYLIGTFQTVGEIFLLQELILGGELFSLIHDDGEEQRVKIGGREARFYSAVIVSALSYLHEHLIVHRDIKPENVLIDDRGYPKLIDFGFSKVLQESATYTFCGTPEYLAPEIIRATGHDLPVDWWALGILIYELMEKRTPFADEDPLDVYQKVQRAADGDGIQFSWLFDWDAADVMRALCHGDAAKRLNARGAREHKFFRGIDFIQLGLKQIEAPFIPVIAHPTDTSNFEPEDDEEEDEEIGKQPFVGISATSFTNGDMVFRDW